MGRNSREVFDYSDGVTYHCTPPEDGRKAVCQLYTAGGQPDAFISVSRAGGRYTVELTGQRSEARVLLYGLGEPARVENAAIVGDDRGLMLAVQPFVGALTIEM